MNRVHGAAGWQPLILNVYLIALCTLVPLYMPEGYLALGEHKFMLFRVLTIAALVPCVLLMLFDSAKEDAKEDARETAVFDRLLFASALAQALCLLFSKDRALSLFGLDGWRDGFFFEAALLLAAYFFAHSFRPFCHLRPVLLAGPAVVHLITVIQCLFFPERGRFFFSTVGNANWYAGFLSVFLPLGVAFLITDDKKSRVRRIFYVVCLVLSLLACVLQQSASVFLSLAVTGMLVLFRKLAQSAKERRRALGARLFRAAVLLAVPVCVIVLFLQMLYPFPGSFGNNRGLLWDATRQILHTFTPREWLFGTGQDTFYNLVSEHASVADSLTAVYGDARVTNAHAELLQMLVTQGLAGLCTWLAFLFYVLRHALREMGGPGRDAALCCILVTLSYLANQTVSFRQVLSTPFVLILAGICFSRDAIKF